MVIAQGLESQNSLSSDNLRCPDSNWTASRSVADPVAFYEYVYYLSLFRFLFRLMGFLAIRMDDHVSFAILFFVASIRAVEKAPVDFAYVMQLQARFEKFFIFPDSFCRTFFILGIFSLCDRADFGA